MPFRRRRVPPYRTHRFIRGVSIKYPGSPADLTDGAKTAVMPFHRTQSTHNPDGTTHGRSLQVRKTERRGLTDGAKTAVMPFRRRRVPPYRTHRFIRGVSIKYPRSPADLTDGAKTADNAVPQNSINPQSRRNDTRSFPTSEENGASWLDRRG